MSNTKAGITQATPKLKPYSLKFSIENTEQIRYDDDMGNSLPSNIN